MKFKTSVWFFNSCYNLQVLVFRYVWIFRIVGFSKYYLIVHKKEINTFKKHRLKKIELALNKLI